MFHDVTSGTGAADLCTLRANDQSGLLNRPITIPQSGLGHRHAHAHASLVICGFIRCLVWSMIDIIQSGKRQSGGK
jgi:hypothetical protein